MVDDFYVCYLQIVSTMVMSIISAVLVWGLFSIAISGLVEDSECDTYFHQSCGVRGIIFFKLS